MCPQYSRLQHFGSVFGRRQQGAVTAEKRRRSCQDTQDAPGGDNGSEDPSRSSDSERIWPTREGQHVHASVTSAPSYLRSWFGRWSRARSAALAGKSPVQETLDPATKNRAPGMGNPTCPRSCCLPMVHRVRTLPLRNLPPGQVGSRWLVAVVPMRKQDRCPCTGRPDSSSNSEPEHWE